MKYYIPIIGELWWSVVLRAHAHWLQFQGHQVMVSCPKGLNYLFEDFEIQELPEKFNEVYGDCPVDSMGRYRGDKRVPWEELNKFFEEFKPQGYEFSPYVKLTYIPRQKFYNYCLWKPFKNLKDYKTNFDDGKIIIFPRYRESKHHVYRNLTKEFYIQLIRHLIDKGYVVVSIGSKQGAYNISERDVYGDCVNFMAYTRYLNLVGQTENIKEAFEWSNKAICTIGGTSALTKMMGMLENPIPSYVIGHEPERFQQEENFFGAKVGFYNCGKDGYQNFNEEECIDQILDFLKELK